MELTDFDYHLPTERIAQKPVTPRDHSRLLKVDRATQSLSDHHFHDLPDLLSQLNRPVLLVRNNTKVFPARLYGQKHSGGACELLLLKRKEIFPESEVWECLTKPGLKVGQSVNFKISTLNDTLLTGNCVGMDGYIRLISFNSSGDALLHKISLIGTTPLPPYIEWSTNDEPEFRKQYQTTYAKLVGSVAAPTAGLHFTPELDTTLRRSGVEIAELTLHVGLGTFQPVMTDRITDHVMHFERYFLSEETAETINQAKRNGALILGVGTTSARVLESCAVPDASGSGYHLEAGSGETNLYIYPGYQYKVLDGLITNFHQPKSTLLMLISALVSEPNTDQPFTTFADTMVGRAYQHAIDTQYRFHSFGDAMVIL